MSDESLFARLLALHTEEERAAALQDACADDPEQRQRVKGLLRALQQAPRFLEEPAALSDFANPPPSVELTWVLSEKYRLLRQIGEGGMGTVFLAEQTQPLARQVAVKIVKQGMDSRAMLQRFDAERQALALMDHPHIAQVFDAGITPDGRPYFVMELAEGLSITRYCDELHLPPPERLELFMALCEAVQHAHQKGIIHRDLKPSNVIITVRDGRPVLKVIDFGVAKLLHPLRDGQTNLTETGMVIGTLQYMSPEQAELTNLDIDTRTDIYSLGVILYELLAGSPPFTIKEMRQAAFTEMLRHIREVEPARPSTRLSSSEHLPSIAANRRLEPRRLQTLLEGDLDWIIMKALAKERERRYETASGLAMDIQRYLSHEPVLAVPPGMSYRVYKFVRRHRQLVWAVVAVAISLVAGIIGTTLAMFNARQAEQQALFETKEKHKALEVAERALQAETLARGKTLEALQAMTDEIMENQLFRRDQLTSETREFLRKIIKHYEGVATITADTTENQAIRAEGHYRVGMLRYRLGEYRDAETAFDTSLTLYSELAARYPSRPLFRQEVARVQNNRGNLFRLLGRMLDAEKAYDASQALRQKLTQDFPESPVHRQELARTLNNLGILYRATSRPLESEKARRASLHEFQKLITEFPAHTEYRVEWAAVSCNLGLQLHDLGQLPEAREALAHGLAQYEQVIRDHPQVPDYRLEVARARNNLAILLVDMHQVVEAQASYQLSITSLKQLSSDFPARPEYRQEWAKTLHNLGELHRGQGQWKEALAAYAEAAALRRKLVTDYPQHHDLRFGLSNTLVDLALLSLRKSAHDDALGLLRESEPHVKAALHGNPRNAEYQELNRRYHVALLQIQAGLGTEEQVIQTAGKLRDVGHDAAEDAYQAASAMALSIPIVERNNTLAPEQVKRQVDRYGQEAVKLLRHAIAQGFKDLARLKNDPDLNGIRTRADFLKLLSEFK